MEFLICAAVEILNNGEVMLFLPLVLEQMQLQLWEKSMKAIEFP